MTFQSDLENFFSKSLLVSIGISEGCSNLNRKSRVLISIERSVANHLSRKDLVVRLTDESDPFFIYTLSLTEEDFQTLKSQQGLLVDFVSFPQKFVHLLDLCLQEELRESPKFLLTLSNPNHSANGTVVLEVVETNPFKYLTHLSLKFIPATDSFVRKYLANCFKALKEEKERLESCLQSTQTDLQERLRQCQTSLSVRNQEFESMRVQLQGEINHLNRRLSEGIREEHEKLLQSRQELEQRLEREKQDLVLKNAREAQERKAKIVLLEMQMKEKEEKLYQAETNVRELRNRFVNSEDELHRLKQKNQTLSKENQNLDGHFHEQLKSLGALKSRLAVLEQEAKDKEVLSQKTQELLLSTQAQKRHLEEKCEQKEASIVKREMGIRSLSLELEKGNEIIQKLQKEIKVYHAKLQMRNEMTTKQEEVLEEKEKDFKRVQEEYEILRTSADGREREVSRLKEEVDDLKDKLISAQNQIKTNENVIAWLNKQLNQAQSGVSLHPVPFTSTPNVIQTGLGNLKDVLQPLVGNRINPYSTEFNVDKWAGQTPPTGGNLRGMHFGNQISSLQRAPLDPAFFHRSTENVEPEPLNPPLAHHVDTGKVPCGGGTKSGVAPLATTTKKSSLGSKGRSRVGNLPIGRKSS